MPLVTVDFSRLREDMNDVQYRGMFCPERHILQQGGAGSGKSWGIADWIHYWCITEVVYNKDGSTKWAHNILITRKVATTILRSVWRLMVKTIQRRGTIKHWTINKSDRILTCDNGAIIQFVGLDDPEKLKSIEGIDTVWAEEATELQEDDIDELKRRVRGETPYQKRLIFSFNPISERTAIYQHFFLSRVPSTRIIKTTWRDNRFLDNEAKQNLRGYKDGSLNKRVYDEGDWGRLEGLVYPSPTIVNQFPITDTLCYGMDFGYTHPSTICLVGIAGKRVYVDEVFYLTEQTEEDLVRQLEANGVRKDLTIWADSAQASAIAAIRKAGYMIRGVNKSKYTVTEGVKKILEYELFCTPRSVNYLRECNSYQWENKRKDQPMDENNHILDAKRYAVLSMQRGVAMAYGF